MPGLKTDEALLETLRSAAKGRLTADEMREQRVSYIMGSLDDDSTITRERIVRVLDELEGVKST